MRTILPPQPVEHHARALAQGIGHDQMPRHVTVDRHSDEDRTGGNGGMIARLAFSTREATKPSPPTITLRPSTWPTTPSPGISATSDGTGSVKPRAFAATTMACATGCLDA